jgi:hypothetical protein
MKLSMVACRPAIILLGSVVAVLGQSNPFGLIAIKTTNSVEGIERMQTTSRLFILGPTNEYKLPILRLVITDKPFMAGRPSLFEAAVTKSADTVVEFKIPLTTNRFPQTAHAQMIDVPITNGPVIEMLVAMFNSPPGGTVVVDVVDADYPEKSKSYIVPVLALQELKQQYVAVKRSK